MTEMRKDIVPGKQQYRNEEPDDDQLIYGTRAVLEAVRSGREFEKLFIQENLHNPLIKELKYALKDAGIIYQYVPPAKLNRLTRNNHQGVVGYISSVPYQRTDEVLARVFESGEVPLLLILDRITDTRNLGAIARTAEGAGAHALIIPSRGSALINADAMKTSAGALNFIPVCREDNLKITIESLIESGLQVIGCTEKTDKLLYDLKLTVPTAIILGSEENGISGEYLKRCTHLAKLPMKGKVHSYNVSVAAAMLLAEAVRQRL